MEELETTYKDERQKIRLSIEREISKLEEDVSTTLPAKIKDVKLEMKEAEKAEKKAAELIPKQLELEPKLQKSSMELYEILKAALEINDKHRTMLSAYHGMAKKTGVSNLKKVSSGFSSIKPLVNTIEKEVTGKKRDFFRWPPNFPV